MEVMEMATTSYSKAVTDALAEKLKALLGREYDLQVGVHDDVRSLQSELEFMRAFLEDYYAYASYQQIATSAHVKVLVRKVRELAYDVEDAIDEFTCRVGPAPKEIPDMVKHFVYTLMARRQIAKQLRHLRSQALELSKQRERYAPLGAPPSSLTVQLPPVQPADEATTNLLVGIDGPRDEFIAKLTSATRKHKSGCRRVASMVGIAGVGKTTLAKAVYHSLEHLFQCRAFVTVSRQPDTRRVLKDILQQVMITTGSESSTGIASMETWEESQIRDRLGDHLKDKRYLIVVDDLWETSAWDSISRALPDTFLDSIVITTTRKQSVARACCLRYHPGHFVYKVASLENLDSRTLFFRRTFGSEDNFPHDLEELSSKILKKCAGLPMAIVCISSLLATTGQEATKWEKVYDPLGSKRNDGLASLWQALEVSYDDLPPHLKVCLLYLSVFPEDCKIGRDRLTRRWITEGIIVAEIPGMSMQEVAENNFSEQIERSMIQAVDVDCFGEIHACTIHDVMFDLIAKKSSEENFVTLIRHLRGKSTSTQQQHVRRLSIDYGTATDDLDLTNFNMTHVRSLTIYGNIDNVDSVPLGRYLRVLDFECCEGVNSRHLNIGELILLKYLSLKSTWISELPPQIGYLKSLETLDLTQTNIRELPVEVARLQSLVHLLASGAELPQGIGNMRSLQILCIRVARKRSKEAVKELLRLTNLRKLDMTYVHPKEKRRYEDEGLNTLPLIISELSKCKLQSLHLNLLGYSISLFRRILLNTSLITSPPDRLQNLRIRGEYGFDNVPRWIVSLSHLSDLELTVRTMQQQDLEIIANLPRLVRFGLTVKEPSRKGIIIMKSGFACLKELFISCRIMPVSFNQGAMPKLEKFELQFRAYQEDSKRTCPSIEHLKSLIKGFQVTIVLGKGLSNRELQHFKNTFKSAIFI